MYKTILTIVRCRCGEELTSLESLSDKHTGTRFMSKRCGACGEITVIRENQPSGPDRPRQTWRDRLRSAGHAVAPG